MNSKGMDMIDRALIKSHEESDISNTDSQYSMETITDCEVGERSQDDLKRESIEDPDVLSGPEDED